MSGFSFPASDPVEKPRRSEKVFDLMAARKMLPLVQRIVADLVHARTCLNRWQPELEGLIRDKISLSWPERQRRYFLEEQSAAQEQVVAEAKDELKKLGLDLIDAESGEVGFPTQVAGRKAWLSWKASEDGLHFYRFDGETSRWPIPPNGLPVLPTSYHGKR